MKLGATDLTRIGQAVNACYAPYFLDRPERAVFPSPHHEVVWGTDADGPRPYGATYWDEALGAFLCVLRGTDSQAEWLADADAGLIPCPFLPGARTHRGFTQIYQTMVCDKQTLGASLKAILRAVEGRTLIVAGHSLGAALATLAAVDVGGADLVTFAGPRVGDDRFVEMAQTRLASNTRIVNDPDLVPKLPVRAEPIFPYAHLGAALELNSAGQVKDEPGAWHALPTYLHLIDPQQPVDPKDALPVA